MSNYDVKHFVHLCFILQYKKEDISYLSTVVFVAKRSVPYVMGQILIVFSSHELY